MLKSETFNFYTVVLIKMKDLFYSVLGEENTANKKVNFLSGLKPLITPWTKLFIFDSSHIVEVPANTAGSNQQFPLYFKNYKITVMWPSICSRSCNVLWLTWYKHFLSVCKFIRLTHGMEDSLPLCMFGKKTTGNRTFTFSTLSLRNKVSTNIISVSVLTHRTH